MLGRGKEGQGGARDKDKGYEERGR